MDITARAVGRAHLCDWEQECCGDPIVAGAIHELVLQPPVQTDRPGSRTAIDWILTHHDDGGPAGSTPLRRVRALVRRVHEVWPTGRLAEIDRVPGHADLVTPEPEEEAAIGEGEVVFTAAYEPVLPETPRPGGWLLDLEILEDLGPHTW